MSQYSKTRYKLVGIGGTFDHFHAGHAFFLTYAAELGQNLLIGITSDSMVFDKHFRSTIEPYAARVKSVKEFCIQNKISCQVIKLTDAYGPTIDRDTKIKALCVTQETLAGAEKINAIRLAAQSRALPVFVANMVKDQTGKELHADRIRAGEVSREGIVYNTLLSSEITISQKQKAVLHEPLGKLISAPNPNELKTKLSSQPKELPICVVGDASLAFFVENKIPYTLGVFDGQTNRSQAANRLLDELKVAGPVSNPAGTITVETSTVLAQLLNATPTTNKPLHLKIDGEEDLVTAALILLLPLKSVVYYGQPGKGIVEVVVTEAVKMNMYSILID